MSCCVHVYTISRNLHVIAGKMPRTYVVGEQTIEDFFSLFKSTYSVLPVHRRFVRSRWHGMVPRLMVSGSRCGAGGAFTFTPDDGARRWFPAVNLSGSLRPWLLLSYAFNLPRLFRVDGIAIARSSTSSTRRLVEKETMGCGDVRCFRTLDRRLLWRHA